MNYFDNLSAEKKISLLDVMLTSRCFEEKVNEMFMKGLIHGTTHLGIGQEAGHAGLSAALAPSDWLLPTHRGHGHFLGKGGSPYMMMAELFGIKYGANKGLGGSMHLTDTANHNMGASGVVAGSVPLAVGMAFALKKQQSDSIVAVVLGDGAFNQGMSQEAFNLANVWSVPILFFCENNRYAMSAPSEHFVSGEIPARAASYGMPAKSVDGNDLPALYDAVSLASEYVRQRKAPFFLESRTYRMLGHSKSDLRKYRTKEEEAEYAALSPILRYEEYLLNHALLNEQEITLHEQQASELIADCAKFCSERVRDIVSFEEAISYMYREEGEHE